jgi:hypothetical protein
MVFSAVIVIRASAHCLSLEKGIFGVIFGHGIRRGVDGQLNIQNKVELVICSQRIWTFSENSSFNSFARGRIIQQY